MVSHLDAMFGRIFDNGTELELLGGLNFVGFTIAADTANGRYTIAIDVPGLGYDSDDIGNASVIAAGSGTVTDALDALFGSLAVHQSLIDTAGSDIDTLQARQIIAGTNLTGGGTLAADRTLNLSATPTGITSINGTRVIAVSQGSNLTNANETIHISGGANYFMPAGTTTAARDKTIGNTGAAEKGIVTIVVEVQGHDVVIKDNGGATLHTVAAGAKQVIDCWYDSGTSLYKLAGWKPLA